MPRKPVVRSREHFYHVTARSNNKDHFFVETEFVWEIMLHQISRLQKEHSIRVAAFVLMNNHFHLLVMTPQEDIDRIMYFFMKDVTKKLQKASGRINKIFGGRYKGCLIDDSKYLLNVYKYIYRNPIAAGLSRSAEDYPYSTYFYHFSETLLPFEIDPIMPINIQVRKLSERDWINQSFREDEARSMKWGLARTKFRYQKDRATNKNVEPV